MRKLLLLALGVLIALPTVSKGTKLPSEGTYHFFIHGQAAGTNKFSIEEKNGKLLITSHTQVRFDEEDYSLDLISRTEADSKTYTTLKFEYKGTEEGKQISGSFSVTKEKISGNIEIDGNTYPYKTKLRAPHTFSLQDFHMEHHILLARAFLASGNHLGQYEIFSPSNTMVVTYTINIESEREIPVGEKAVICKKLSITTSTSYPIFSFVDTKENLPIYIGFPSSKTEAFLESYYGKNPTSFYRMVEGAAKNQKE